MGWDGMGWMDGWDGIRVVVGIEHLTVLIKEEEKMRKKNRKDV